jgi:hypothetical protein
VHAENVANCGINVSHSFKGEWGKRKKRSLWIWRVLSFYQLIWNNMSMLYTHRLTFCRENHRPVANHWQAISHNVVSSSPRHAPDSKSQ